MHDLDHVIKELFAAPLAQVRQKYREVLGEEPRSNHRESLIRRIAWRLQANREGVLSERARQRALAIANDAEIRLLPPRRSKAAARFDSRIPEAGAIIEREFRGQTVRVKVLPKSFEYQGCEYRSLSSIATEIAGTRWNGLAFFGLTGPKGAKRKARHATTNG